MRLHSRDCIYICTLTSNVLSIIMINDSPSITAALSVSGIAGIVSGIVGAFGVFIIIPVVIIVCCCCCRKR